MNVRFYQCILLGLLAISGSFAANHDANTCDRKDGAKAYKKVFVTDDEGKIYKLMGYNSDGTYAYVVEIKKIQSDKLKELSKDYKK
ncbi:MAG: hypothetical protein VX835_04185 [Pseudomonadota bacterium]|nr:hypothetical protein [Pseudomonadota bacterium]